jgi:hypothetical protein
VSLREPHLAKLLKVRANVLPRIPLLGKNVFGIVDPIRTARPNSLERNSAVPANTAYQPRLRAAGGRSAKNSAVRRR